jgi:hypothetical protein
MGRPPATINITLYVPEDWTLRQNRRRDVFTDVLSARVRQLSNEAQDAFRLYNSFHTILHRGLYNTKIFYGKRAIDIDKPLRDGTAVSVRLKIIIGEGEDNYEKIVP